MANVLSLNGIPVEANGPSLPGRGVPVRNGLGRNDPEPYGAVAVTLACDFGNVWGAVLKYGKQLRSTG